MPFLTAIANEINDLLVNGGSWTAFTDYDVSLHTDDPGTDGSNEVTGGSYARQEPSFGASSSKVATSDTKLTFAGMPSCTVKYVGLWGYRNAAWEFIYSDQITDEVVAAGNAVVIDTGSMTSTLT